MTRSRVARGGALVVSQTVVTKALSFLSQVVLGWLLVPDEFGLYAMALAVAMVARAFQDRGVRDVIIRQGSGNYSELAGPASRLAVGLNILSALVLVTAAVPLERVLASPGLALLLLIIGAEMCLSTPWAIYSARLASEYRFSSLVTVSLIGVGLRFGLTIAFAVAGFGALSMVLPLPLVSLVRWMLGRWLLGEVGLRRRSSTFTWRSLLPTALTLAAGGLALGAFQQGHYLAIGLSADTAVVGVFYFAFQLSHQLVTLLTSALQAVLFPALSRLSGEPARFLDAAASALGVVVTAVALLGGMLSLSFPLVEQLVWDGRWIEATPVVQALALGMAGRAVVEMVKTVLLSAGQYHVWLLSITTLAGGIFLITGAAAVIWGTAPAIGQAVALYLTVVGLIGSALLSRIRVVPANVQSDSSDPVQNNPQVPFRSRHGNERSVRFLRRVWTPWIICISWTLLIAGLAPVNVSDPRAGATILRLALYIVLTMITLRLTAVRVFEDATSLLPPKLKAIVSRLLCLNRQDTAY